MSLCIGACGEDFALVASDCYYGQREKRVEIGGRVGSLPGGWVTYTALDAGMAKVAAGALEAAQVPAYRPRALQRRVTWAYEELTPQLRGPIPGPDTEGTGIESIFFVASVGLHGPFVWMLCNDDVSKAIKPGQAYVSPPPQEDDALQEAREDNVLREYMATAPDVWTAFRRAGEVQQRVQAGCDYVSRRTNVCAVAPEDGRWTKWVLSTDSDELAEMDPDAIREAALAFEGCMSPEVLQERERKRAAAGGGR